MHGRQESTDIGIRRRHVADALRGIRDRVTRPYTSAGQPSLDWQALMNGIG
jgi:hypothetical protein